MKKILLSTLAAAAIASATPAYAVGYQFYDGTIHLGRPKALDIFNLDWEFANDPNWGHEIFDCSLMGYVLATFQVWQTHHLPPPPPVVYNPPPIDVTPPPDVEPPYVPPVVINPPPCLTCGPPIVVPQVPEASTWAMMLIGFACIGFSMFRQRVTNVSRG